jgi:hypothetical protein
MDDPLLMSGIQRSHNLNGDIEQFSLGESGLPRPRGFDALPQSLALQ